MSNQIVLSVTPTGGTAPYSVQFYRKVDNWDYTPDNTTALGAPVTVALDGGTATYTDNTPLPGVSYIYKAMVTDSSTPTRTVPAGDYLYVEGLRADPGPLPASILPAAAAKLLLATWGDSITAPGTFSTNLRTYLTAAGANVARTANVGFQGSKWLHWKASDDGSAFLDSSIQEGAVDTNTGFTYASEYDPGNAEVTGQHIPGTNALGKAFRITDDELGRAGAGTLLLIVFTLGMNDLLQEDSQASILANAISVIGNVRTKYPTALIVINHNSYGFPGNNGPVNLADITTCHAAYAAIITALVDNVHVFKGDDSFFYYLYANYAGTGSGILIAGGDQADFLDGAYEHVHINAQGAVEFVVEAGGKFGMGPAILRGALAPPAPTVPSSLHGVVQSLFASDPFHALLAAGTFGRVAVEPVSGNLIVFAKDNRSPLARLTVQYPATGTLAILSTQRLTGSELAGVNLVTLPDQTHIAAAIVTAVTADLIYTFIASGAFGKVEPASGSYLVVYAMDNRTPVLRLQVTQEGNGTYLLQAIERML